MKIILNAEWHDVGEKYCEPCETLLIIESGVPLEIAWVGESNLFIRFPGMIAMNCESIADGKAKVVEHLRSSGALAEGG